MKQSIFNCLAILFLFIIMITSPSLTFAQSEGRDGNNNAPQPKPKNDKPSYSERYRERFNSDNYRDRNSGENYRQTAIEEGQRRRREHFSGGTKIRFDSLPLGATMGRPPQDISRDMYVDIGEKNTTFYSGKGLRLPLPNAQPRQFDPLRQQRVQSIIQPPALLRQYVNQTQLLNASQTQSLQPQPVGNVPLGFQQPQNNRIQTPNRYIPPVNQRPVRPNNDLQPFQPQANYQPNQLNGTVRNTPNFLPYPLNQQRIPANQRRNYNNSNRLNTRPYSSQSNPRLNQRFQPVQPNQNQSKSDKKPSKTTDQDSSKQQ